MILPSLHFFVSVTFAIDAVLGSVMVVKRRRTNERVLIRSIKLFVIGSVAIAMAEFIRTMVYQDQLVLRMIVIACTAIATVSFFASALQMIEYRRQKTGKV